MFKESSRYKHYNSAKDRFLKPAIMNFFQREFPNFLGPVPRANLADELTDIFNKMCPETKHINHGEILWNALDKHTRADSPKRKYIPVTLTLVSTDDVEQLIKGTSVMKVKLDSIARVFRQAYEQGGILSSRDIALIFNISDSYASILRLRYEKENNTTLPHTGSLHDMGTTVTHKVQIVYKVIVEKKDPIQVAYETNHSQNAVDRYLNDFYRVKTIYKDNQDLDYIHVVTNITKYVVAQYIEIIEKYVKEL